MMNCTYLSCDQPIYARTYCRKHYQYLRRGPGLPPNPSTLERFMAKVKVLKNGCWEWQGSLNNSGYGKFGYNGTAPGAHRAAYELFVGPIPEGYEPDHLCHTNDAGCSLVKDCPHRRCVNPDHLELVTRKENLARMKRIGRPRQTLCQRGHPLSGDNLGVCKNNERYCKTCRRTSASQRYLRNLSTTTT